MQLLILVQNGSLHQKDTVHDNDFEPYLSGQSNQKLLSGHPEGSFLENGAQLSPRVSVRFWVGFSPSGTKLDASTPSRGACRMQRAWGSSARGFLLLHGGSGGLGGAQREHSVTGTGCLWLRLGAGGVLRRGDGAAEWHRDTLLTAVKLLRAAHLKAGDKRRNCVGVGSRGLL
ncbi:hypothetical protein J1605_012986 [Eschrichtius robustus]|uniref:Uncharacterized protein n=1 Tax=Eschrichtius robustus TaxID=9764 RepID=A0AB34GK21_ESCRO|nr:hypothetical protein J1605_012986 [Eschrichtius robustus]